MSNDTPTPTVTILWGCAASRRENQPVTYTFKTDAELLAFMQGVDEAVGWAGFEIKRMLPEDAEA